MYRIYLNLAAKAIKSKKRCDLFLSYLKLRTIAKNAGGRFYLSDAIKVLGLSERTTKKHLSQISEVSKTENGYKLSFSDDLRKNKKSSFVLISQEQLMSYSWRNIADFHAFLSELEVERYKRHQRAVVKGYWQISSRDKCRMKYTYPKGIGAS